MAVRMTAALPAVAVPLRVLAGLGGILELAQCVAQRFDLPVIGPLLDFDFIEHFRNLFQVAECVIQSIDDGQNLLRGFLEGAEFARRRWWRRWRSVPEVLRMLLGTPVRLLTALLGVGPVGLARERGRFGSGCGRHRRIFLGLRGCAEALALGSFRNGWRNTACAGLAWRRFRARSFFGGLFSHRPDGATRPATGTARAGTESS